MKITLKDEDGSTLVLERGSNDPAQAAYRDRTMTLDGKVIARGAVSQGDRTDDDIRNGNQKRNRVLSAAVDLGCEDRRKSKIRR